mmetsp:Transcript_37173/g.50310  ORF Transcript_37173/g.50310 Transcript_37173/m.50310 type:complete len:85 (+) Transcript_37173:81-335(+)
MPNKFVVSNSRKFIYLTITQTIVAYVKRHLLIMTNSGRITRKIASTPVLQHTSRWSPDGSKIHEYSPLLLGFPEKKVIPIKKVQ